MKLSNIVFCIAFMCFGLSLQLLQAQTNGHCGTEELFLLESEENKSLISQRKQFESEITHAAAQVLNSENFGGPKIIPVVFHVIHEYGPENISKAQIIDQIRILNEDFRRTNADTTNTPTVFLPVAADCNIEFRLAQLDPQGNCTDGIVRVYSSLTNSGIGDGAQLKALSRWPNNKYLNYWVVRTITGGILGYATFPGGNPNVDGVVCGHNYTGSIGTAVGSAYDLGRTATHEVGHWLSLRHIWGDSNCGDDLVADTPTASGSNFGCVSFPHVSCNNGPNGDMFMNYMDYSDDVCFNVFTSGQSARMNAALNNSASGRNNLWTQSNLIATGTDGSAPGACNLIADLNTEVQMICTGDSIEFIDISWNGDVDTWAWTFPGGTPSSSTIQNPVIYYNTPGTYDVSLTVTNAAGSDSITRTGLVIVRSAQAMQTVPYSENFDATALGSVPSDYLSINLNGINAWQVSNIASMSGSKSVYINNLVNNTDGIDELITTSFNLANVSATQMTFDLAYAVRSSTSADQLKIFASNDCGETWGLRYTKSGAALSTAGIVISNFVPGASEWRQETVNFSTASVSGRDHVMFKFQFLNKGGNNIYIDNINLSGVVGVNEVNVIISNFNLVPNPANGFTTIELELKKPESLKINVVDLNGRIVNQVVDKMFSPGLHSIPVSTELSNGVYFVTLQTQNVNASKKLIIIN